MFTHSNLDFSNKIKNDFFNKKVINTYKNSLDLVHYSFSNKGSANIYKKITLSGIFMMQPFLFSKNRKVNKDNFGYFNQLSFGGDFQQKYCYITTVQQIKRNNTPTLFNNDSSSIGTFKNIFYTANQFSLNSIYSKYREASRTEAYKTRNLFLLKNINSMSGLKYYGLVQMAWSNVFFRTQNYVTAYNNFFYFSKEVSSIKVKENLITSLVLLNKFIRTVWFRSAMVSANLSNPVNFFDNNGMYSIDAATTDYVKSFNASEVQLSHFSALGSFENNKIDVIKYLKNNRKGGIYKKHVKDYPM